MQHYSPHLSTAVFPPEERVELARADVAAGRMTAEDALDLAADLARDARERVADEVWEERREAEFAKGVAEEARGEVVTLEDEADRLRKVVQGLVREMAAAEKEARTHGKGAERYADQLKAWQDRIGRAFGIWAADQIAELGSKLRA